MRRPVDKGRPSHGVVASVAAVDEEVEDGQRAVGVVLFAVLERVGDARGEEGLAAEEMAAEAFVGEQVGVGVDEAADGLTVGAAGGGRGAEEGRAGDVDGGVGGWAEGGVPPAGGGGLDEGGGGEEGEEEEGGRGGEHGRFVFSGEMMSGGRNQAIGGAGCVAITIWRTCLGNYPL